MSKGKERNIVSRNAMMQSTSDPFRRMVGKMYSTQQGEALTLVNTKVKDVDIEISEARKGNLELLGNKMSSIVLKSADDKNKIEDILIKKMGISDFAAAERSPDQIAYSNITTQRDFSDYNFSVSLPYSKKESEVLPQSNEITTADISYNYNYLIPKYENQLGDKAIDEKILPSVYNYFNNKTDIERRVVNLRNPVNADEFERHQAIDKPNKERIQRDYIGFMGSYATRYRGISSTDTKIETVEEARSLSKAVINSRYMVQSSNNFVITSDNYDMLDAAVAIKNNFPMHVDISFTLDKGSFFSDCLRETKLELPFLASLLYRPDGDNNIDTVDTIESFRKLDGAIFPRTDRLETSFKRTHDVLDMIKRHVTVPSGFPKVVRFLGDVSESYSLYTSYQKRFELNLKNMVLLGKLKTLSDNVSRDYNQLVNQQKCHSEVVLYKVSKYRSAGNNPANLVQNYWIFNNPDRDQVNIVDTQVRYGESYTYKINAYVLVVGSVYSYNDVTKEMDGKKELKVNVVPSIKLFEVPFYSYSNRMVDAPPVPPEVDLLPYKGSENNFLIMLNNPVGKVLAQPIPLMPLDAERYSLAMRAQNNTDIGQIEFKSEEIPRYFEVFRIQKKPLSYFSFTNRMVYKVETKVGTLNNIGANSTSFMETIEANKKYYYTFRTVDFHGNTSNPSPIYEVEMVNEDGRRYLMVRLHEIEVPKPYVYEKTFRKMISVRPGIMHSDIGPRTNSSLTTARANLNNFEMINPDESVWGKKFKIRVKSKNTGRIIDFNLKFKTKFDES